MGCRSTSKDEQQPLQAPVNPMGAPHRLPGALTPPLGPVSQAVPHGSTGGNDGLSAKFQEPSIPVSSGDLGLLPSPLSAGPRWASVPVALMRVTGSEKLPCDRFRGEPFADAVCVPPSLCPGGCTRICVFISEDCHSRM